MQLFAEFEFQPAGPKLILGDINGDIQSFPALHAAVQAEDYTDLGNYPGLCSVLAQPTCHMRQHDSHTRRDYVFANHAALPIISSFRVVDDHLLPTHSALVITIKMSSQMPKKLSL